MVTSACRPASEIITELLGVPFLEHGRDPGAGLDCLGLVLHVYREALGVDLPDPWSGSMREALERLSGQFMRARNPAPGDLLYFHRRPCQGDQRHVAFVESERWATHSVFRGGVERKPLYLMLQEGPEIHRHISRW